MKSAINHVLTSFHQEEVDQDFGRSIQDDTAEISAYSLKRWLIVYSPEPYSNLARNLVQAGIDSEQQDG